MTPDERNEAIEQSHLDLQGHLQTLLRTSHALLDLWQIHVHSLEQCAAQAVDLQSLYGTPASESLPSARTENSSLTSGPAETSDTPPNLQQTDWKELNRLLEQQRASTFTDSILSSAKDVPTGEKLNPLSALVDLKFIRKLQKHHQKLSQMQRRSTRSDEAATKAHWKRAVLANLARNPQPNKLFLELRSTRSAKKSKCKPKRKPKRDRHSL